MGARFATGDLVQTRLGAGIVREVRRHGRLVVELKGHRLELAETDVAGVPAPRTTRGRRAGAAPRVDVASRDDGRSRPAAVGVPVAPEIDLHGLTVEAALDLVERAVNDALVNDRGGLRLIHGRSGGRIRGALHRWLRGVTAVRAFHLDPRNAGVTVVIF